nr:nadh-ubiquinone oxidoreductase 18 kda subunit [Quercus suber]
MANSLQRSIWSHGRGLRTTLVHWSRPFSADALVERKPSEIGVVSGIPDEHLRRRVNLSSSFFLGFQLDSSFFDSVSDE